VGSVRKILMYQWIRLAVDKLNLCHTQGDVELALHQLPLGMQALYDRMASSIAQNPSATERALASAILQCVTCSKRVLTVPELSQALHEDTSGMLDFQRSIMDLCGGFVVIDNSGSVAMIHQTAREYLLSVNDSPFVIDRGAAHKQLFLSCMRCLMAIGLRAKVKDYQKPEFLDYAASSWSSHLISAPLDCGQVVEALNKFLTGTWVLTWVQVLAASKQLRVLIQASKYLSKYSIKLKENDAARNERTNHIMNQELTESWAVDFVKILGKFGMILRQNPESIYKLIPPFCPQNSAIYQQFGKLKDKSLLVSGLSTENWDDSLARISFGFGTYASSISAAGAQIAVLVSSGSVYVYDSVIFEEVAASPIKHGERVYRMELNSTGTLLATYGYRTTKIWEVSTGNCRVSIENIGSRPRPLAMLLTNNDTTLLVGTDDRRIRSLDLNQSSPSWQLVAELEELELEGHFLNSSSYMALNKDGKLIAVAYRGHPLSAWETDGPVHIGHCWRKREEISRGEVIEAVWHPHYPEILGLYIEGVVFKWRPYDDETDEVAAGASRLAISRDGNLFATGDVRGTVKVYTTSDLDLLYQLVSEDSVLGLAFSPDLRRFYDIRGYYGSAWEPNALMRFAEQRGRGNIDTGSETESLTRSSAAYESRSGRIDSITVLAGSPMGNYYCCGTEKGTVHLHHTQRGKLANLHNSKGFLSIEQMTWSNNGRYLCFSDSSKKVFVTSISPNTGDSKEPNFETILEIPMKNSTDGPILQLLFHPNATQLLIRSSSLISTISLTSSSVTRSLKLHTAESKWIIHPHDPALLIGVGPTAIHILDWDLNEQHIYNLEQISPQDTPSTPQKSPPDQEQKNTVDRVLVTNDKKHILVQTSPLNQNSKEKIFHYFETSSCATSAGLESTITITSCILPRNLSTHIALALSFLSHDNLIFLSRTFSICSLRFPFRTTPPLPTPAPPPSLSKNLAAPTTNLTVTPLNHHHHHHNRSTDLNSARDGIKELFPLPGDWMSRDCLALCSIWGVERSLLCPRNGEVAVVRCTALI
jgi:WD40 repeat protein